MMTVDDGGRGADRPAWCGVATKGSLHKHHLRKILLAAFLATFDVEGFAPLVSKPRLPSYPAFPPTPHLQQFQGRLWSASADKGPSDDSESLENVSLIGVVAPLKYEGPYPVIALRFPNLSTSEQGPEEGGTVLDFVLDTGANVNSIDERLVDKLGLSLVTQSKDLPIIGSAGVGGTFQAGDIFLLGDCQLAGLPEGQNFTFMTNLTASALPHSMHAANGLLALPFFLSFQAGFEFDWHGTDGDPPTVIFYYGKEPPKDVLASMHRIPLERLAVQVLSLTINVNGTDMKALLDTGSPVTILSHQAAKQAGIDAMPELSEQPALQRKEQKIGDDALTIRGVDSRHVNLYRSVSPVSIRAGDVSLGEGSVYIGDLPILNLMGDLFGSSPPAVVLGLDSLRRTYRMILRAPDNEVWFEEMPKS